MDTLLLAAMVAAMCNTAPDKLVKPTSPKDKVCYRRVLHCISKLDLAKQIPCLQMVVKDSYTVTTINKPHGFTTVTKPCTNNK